MKKPIDLYCMALQDRSDRVRWLLEEMNVPYTNHFMPMGSAEKNSPEYRKLNPMNRVPTIVDEEIVLHESAAICMYLADKYSYGKLAPESSNVKERALYTQWMIFSVGTLEAVVARMFTHMNSPAEIAETLKYVKEQSAFFKMALNPILERQDYILESGFSAADIMLGAVIPGAHDDLIKDNPPIQKYMERLKAREAAIRAKVF